MNKSEMMSIKIGFIGLGTMGLPMAKRLIKAGYKLKVFDVSSIAMANINSNEAKLTSSPKEAAVDVDFCITMLPESTHVEEVVLGNDGLIESLKENSILIEMSTILPSVSLSIYKKLKSKNIKMIDAPVGRTPEDAIQGTLLIIAGGDKKNIEIAKPILHEMGDEIIHVGPISSGIKMKLVNNYMSMVGMVMTAETLAFANKLDINQETAVKIIQKTAAGKGQINVNFPKKVLAGDISPDFPLRMGLKDISLALSLGSEVEMPLKLGSVSEEYFSYAAKSNRADYDCTAMLHIIEEIAKNKN